MIKLIATDMDGTWLNSQRKYNIAKFKKIMKLTQEKNIKFVVASGNQFENLLTRFPKEYWSQMYFIAENGAYVLHGHEPLSIVDFNDEEIATIKRIEGQMHGKSVWAGVSSAYVLKKYGEKFAKCIHQSNEKLKRVDSFEEVTDRFLKVTVTTEPGYASKVAKELRAKNSNIDIVAGCDWSVDFSKVGISKASGLRLLGQRLGISPNEMVSFGDSGNDVEMLHYTGRSYATSTALVEAKLAAKSMIGSSDNSAVQDKILELLME
ncbi:HAD-IIB family hydrolase [Lactobacillus porci]|uniref:HAD-IIB family hydrolase n=1 Tax=Lactobacillus porci TaxID=2012477 RepID=UPI003995DA2B